MMDWNRSRKAGQSSNFPENCGSWILGSVVLGADCSGTGAVVAAGCADASCAAMSRRTPFWSRFRGASEEVHRSLRPLPSIFPVAAVVTALDLRLRLLVLPSSSFPPGVRCERERFF